MNTPGITRHGPAKRSIEPDETVYPVTAEILELLASREWEDWQ